MRCRSRRADCLSQSGGGCGEVQHRARGDPRLEDRPLRRRDLFRPAVPDSVDHPAGQACGMWGNDHRIAADPADLGTRDDLSCGPLDRGQESGCRCPLIHLRRGQEETLTGAQVQA